MILSRCLKNDAPSKSGQKGLKIIVSLCESKSVTHCTHKLRKIFEKSVTMMKMNAQIGCGNSTLKTVSDVGSGGEMINS